MRYRVSNPIAHDVDHTAVDGSVRVPNPDLHVFPLAGDVGRVSTAAVVNHIEETKLE